MSTPHSADVRALFGKLERELIVRARLLVAGTRRREGTSQAEDLVQETLAKLLEAYGAASLVERSHANVFALAYRTMKNLVIDESRRKRAILAPGAKDGDDEAPAHDAPDPRPLADTLLGGASRTARVQAALAALKPDERRFLLDIMEHDSVPAAQERCGWPPASPYYVFKKLLKQLRDALGSEVGHDLAEV